MSEILKGIKSIEVRKSDDVAAETLPLCSLVFNPTSKELGTAFDPRIFTQRDLLEVVIEGMDKTTAYLKEELGNLTFDENGDITDEQAN